MSIVCGPVLEFGQVRAMVDYLAWLLIVQAVPADRLALSLDWLAEFLSEHMEAEDGAVVSAAIRACWARLTEGDPDAFVVPESPGF